MLSDADGHVVCRFRVGGGMLTVLGSEQHGGQLAAARLEEAHEVVFLDVAAATIAIVGISRLRVGDRVMLGDGHMADFKARNRIDRRELSGMLLDLIRAGLEGGGYGRAVALRCERGWVGRGRACVIIRRCGVDRRG